MSKINLNKRKLNVSELPKMCTYVSIAGEGGVGKSKLVRAVMARAKASIEDRSRKLPIDIMTTRIGRTAQFSALVHSFIQVYTQPTVISALRGYLPSDEFVKVLVVMRESRSVAKTSLFIENLAVQSYNINVHGGSSHRVENRVSGTILENLTNADKKEMNANAPTSLPTFAKVYWYVLTKSDDDISIEDQSRFDLNRWTALQSPACCEALTESGGRLTIALVHFARLLQDLSSGVISVRTENMKLYQGAKFTAKGARDNTFIAQWPPRTGEVNNLSWVCRAHPLDLIRASALIAAVHVGTLDARYEEGVDNAKTLSGGMSSAIMGSSQELSDLATHTGSFIAVEVRDDFAKKNAQKAELAALFGSSGADESQSRFMSTSEIALYINKRGSGSLRRRAFRSEDVEFTDLGVQWTLDDIDYQDVASLLTPEVSDYDEIVRLVGLTPDRWEEIYVS